MGNDHFVVRFLVSLQSPTPRTGKAKSQNNSILFNFINCNNKYEYIDSILLNLLYINLIVQYTQGRSQVFIGGGASWGQ
jgi:hypothetical protein